MPHMYEGLALQCNFEKIIDIRPGVFGETNLSSETVIASIASAINAACILTIDSTYCKDEERLCSTIQLSNSGMQTYFGTAHLRQSALGIPTISIDVPTAITARDLSKRQAIYRAFFTPITKFRTLISMTAAFLLGKSRI